MKIKNIEQINRTLLTDYLIYLFLQSYVNYTLCTDKKIGKNLKQLVNQLLWKLMTNIAHDEWTIYT